MALPLYALDGGDGAVNYTTVYLIERSLSLDNLFVFLLIFGVLRGCPTTARPKLLFWGIVLALVLRGLAILVGVELIERFHVVIYMLGATLLVPRLADPARRGRGGRPRPQPRGAARAARRAGHEDYEGGASVTRSRHRAATPLLLALAAIVAADIAFAVDSIPAAFAITTDAFADLGGERVRAAGPALAVRARRGARAALPLPRRDDRRRPGHRSAVKLLVEDVVHIGPVVSLASCVVCLRRRDHVLRAGRPPRPEGAAERRADRDAQLRPS